jgi:hypothetical protein
VPVESEPSAPPPEPAPLAPAPSASPDASATAAPPVAAAPATGSERQGPPLPELRVKSFGLHIGGGSKDAEARAEYLALLEAGSWRYLDCYREIESPGSEGTFGADLQVAGTGGTPRVEHPRTKLKGADFRTCMTDAFASVRFPKTPSGRPVVVSYSVKFSLAF